MSVMMVVVAVAEVEMVVAVEEIFQYPETRYYNQKKVYKVVYSKHPNR